MALQSFLVNPHKILSAIKRRKAATFFIAVLLLGILHICARFYQQFRFVEVVVITEVPMAPKLEQVFSKYTNIASSIRSVEAIDYFKTERKVVTSSDLKKIRKVLAWGTPYSVSRIEIINSSEAVAVVGRGFRKTHFLNLEKENEKWTIVGRGITREEPFSPTIVDKIVDFCRLIFPAI